MARHSEARSRLRAPARAAVLAALCLAVLRPGAAGQTVGVLRITVTLADDGQPARPVPRHVLLVSDNPASTAPRRVITAADGTASLRLPPGNYTLESDQPVIFQATSYSWRQTLDVVAGAETVLALTAANAEAGTSPGAPTTGRVPDASDVLLEWENSVVALWTPTAHASGVIIDAQGFVVTSQQVVGAADAVEVQFGATLKVAGRVLVSDAATDVAVLWLDPAALPKTAPIPPACVAPTKSALVNGQEVVALGVPRGRNVRMTTGAVNRVSSRTMIADLGVDEDAIGGPVFAIGGQMVGVTSFVGEKEGDRGDDTRVVRIDAVCDAVAAARKKTASATPPSGARLPMEPSSAVREDTLKGQAQGRAGSLSPYPAASAGFDIAFITPVIAYAGRDVMDFANWSAYVADQPPVLFLRVTPKQSEKFWATLARGVAMTQGIALPPIKTYKPGFSRLRAFCGETEVTPVHPFVLERRVSETTAVREGLYAFGPLALSPECGTVTLHLFSEKEPGTAETVAVDPKLLQQVWLDFAPYRAAK